MARVFSLKHSSTFMGNVGMYSVGTESVYQIAQFDKTECFTGVSREGLPASYSRDTAISICPDSSHSSHVQGICIISQGICIISQDAQPRATRKNSSVFNCLSLHTLSFFITQLLQLNLTINTGYKRLNKITIKFDMELKPTKHIVVNYNFTGVICILPINQRIIAQF